MATVTPEEREEAERVYNMRREPEDPPWEEAHLLVRSYYIWLARKRLA